MSNYCATKSEEITMTNQNKEKWHKEPITTKKKRKPPEARENAGDKVAIVFSFVFDWLKIFGTSLLDQS